MERSWFTERDQMTEGGEASAVAQAKAMTLAGIADSDFLDSMIRVKAAMDAFGGQVWIGAERRRFSRDGEEVSINAPGQHLTVAYVFNYKHKLVKGLPEEPDLNFAQGRELYHSELRGSLPPTDPEANGATPEPVAATPEGSGGDPD